MLLLSVWHLGSVTFGLDVRGVMVLTVHTRAKWWEENDVAITAISSVYSSAPQTKMHAEKVLFYYITFNQV